MRSTCYACILGRSTLMRGHQAWRGGYWLFAHIQNWSRKGWSHSKRDMCQYRGLGLQYQRTALAYGGWSLNRYLTHLIEAIIRPPFGEYVDACAMSYFHCPPSLFSYVFRRLAFGRPETCLPCRALVFPSSTPQSPSSAPCTMPLRDPTMAATEMVSLSLTSSPLTPSQPHIFSVSSKP